MAMSTTASDVIQGVIDQMVSAATSGDDDNLPEWTSENRATIDEWQVKLSDGLALLLEQLHDANGVADLAIKHRDVAEAAAAPSKSTNAE